MRKRWLGRELSSLSLEVNRSDRRQLQRVATWTPVELPWEMRRVFRDHSAWRDGVLLLAAYWARVGLAKLVLEIRSFQLATNAYESPF